MYDTGGGSKVLKILRKSIRSVESLSPKNIYPDHVEI